mmetsp:Transcript_1185/g.1877  ORF Transcript_1185/g.1877 Transcript_1185/m.1877 type:complete len:275 (+) Transcript_1185:52-876(+)
MEKERFEWLSLARNLAAEAGVLIRAASESVRSEGAGQEKSCSVDLVTEYDRQAEDIILSKIRDRYPGHGIISEESNPKGELKKVTWVVDPIDGTTNFIAGLPEVAVSIGIIVDGKPEVGVVYNPIRNEIFHAVRGCGAFLDDRPIHVNKGITLSQAIVCVEFGYVRTNEGAVTMLEPVRKLLSRSVRTIRMIGSGTLDLCFVACGRLDAVYAGVAGEGWYPWDYAAGGLIAEEAGAKLCKVDGSEFSIFGDSVVCSSPSIVGDILEVIRPESEN